MAKNLSKIIIIEKLHIFVGLSRSDCSLFLDEFFKVMLKSLELKENIKIANFGTFLVKYKKERIGRNPKTKIEVTISARSVVKFKPSKSLIIKINKQ